MHPIIMLDHLGEDFDTRYYINEANSTFSEALKG